MNGDISYSTKLGAMSLTNFKKYVKAKHPKDEAKAETIHKGLVEKLATLKAAEAKAKAAKK